MTNLFTIGLMLTAIDKASSVINAMCNKSVQDLTRLQQKFNEIGEKMQSLGMKSMAAGFVMTGAIQKTIREFADLEEAQTFLKTTMMDAAGKVSEEYEKMLRLADKLGTELPGTTKDMLEMFIALREQGVQTRNILGGVGEAAAKFAVLMKLPYKEAATYVAKFQEVMGVAETQMVQFMDQLQRLKFASGIEVSDLASTFRYLGPTLQMLGLQGLDNAKKLSAVLGVLATRASEGSQAGTNFAEALKRMAEVGHRMDAKRLREFLEPLRERGLELRFFTETGRFRGIEAMIKELEKLRVLSEQERLVVLGKLFGSEAARPLSVLIQAGLAGYKEMLDRMEKQADMEKKIAEITGTIKNRWDQLSGTVTNLVAYFGGLTAKTLGLAKIMQVLNDLAGKLAEWMKSHERLAGILGAGIAIIGGTLVVFGGALMMLGFAFKMMAGGMQAISTFRMALQMAIPVIRLKRLELLRLIGVQKLMNYVSYHGGFFRALQYFMLTTRLRFLELIGATRAWIAMQARIVLTHIISGFRMAALAVRAFSVSAIAGIRALSMTLVTTPVGWLIVALGGLVVAGYLLYRNWDKVTKGIQVLWQGVKDALGRVTRFITSLDLFDAGAKIMESLWRGMKAFAMKPVEVVKEIAQKIKNLLPFSPAREGPLAMLHKVNIIGTIAENIRPEPLLSRMHEVLEKVRGLREPLVQPVKQVLEPVTAFAKPLIQPVKQVLEPVTAFAKPLIQPVKQVLEPVTAFVKPLIQPVKQVLEPARIFAEPSLRPVSLAGAYGASINVTQTLNITFTGEETERRREVITQVAHVTKEAIFKAIDEYFYRKARREWR